MKIELIENEKWHLIKELRREYAYCK